MKLYPENILRNPVCECILRDLSNLVGVNKDGEEGAEDFLGEASLVGVGDLDDGRLDEVTYAFVVGAASNNLGVRGALGTVDVASNSR